MVGAVLLGTELLYVLAANAVIVSGVIQRAAAASPDKVDLGWNRAYSPWPGRVYVSGFRVGVQDPVMQFRLTIDAAKLDVALWALLHKTFRASHIHAEGVSFRFLTRVDGTAGRERRVEAFPPIEGLPRPALLPKPRPPPLTPAQVEMLWTVQLDDVQASVTELWLLEFRYHGPARVSGGFALSPLRKLWIGPALLDLDGGELRAGEHVISSAFALNAEVTIAPVDLRASPGVRVLQALTTSIHFDTALEDLGAAELYLDGLGAHGSGRLSAALEIAGGRLKPGSTLEASLPGTSLQFEGQRFTGDTHATFSVGDVGDVANEPTLLASLRGALSLKLPDMKVVEAGLSEVSAKAILADDDLSSGLSLKRLYAVVGEASVPDARPVTGTIAKLVPFFAKIFAQIVLGNGPLVASATAYVTPEYTLVRLKHLQLGDAELEGAAVPGADGWTGAAAGHFGSIPLGLRLHHNTVETVLFAPSSWLGFELLKVGIEPELAQQPPALQAPLWLDPRSN